MGMRERAAERSGWKKKTEAIKTVFTFRVHKLAGNRRFDYIVAAAAAVYGFIYLFSPVRPRSHHTRTHLFIRSKNANLSNPFTFRIVIYTLSRESRFFIPPRSRASLPADLLISTFPLFFAARPP